MFLQSSENTRERKGLLLIKLTILKIWFKTFWEVGIEKFTDQNISMHKKIRKNNILYIMTHGNLQECGTTFVKYVLSFVCHSIITNFILIFVIHLKNSQNIYVKNPRWRIHQTLATHLATARDTPVCRDTPVEKHCCKVSR